MRGSDTTRYICAARYVCATEMATSRIFIKSVFEEMGRRKLTLVTEMSKVVPA